MSLPAIKRRYEKKSYRNFNLAIYCPVQNISQIDDFDAFNEKFDAAFGDMKIGRVYLEDFRGFATISKERLLQVKTYFEQKGIDTAGGITTCAANNPEFGFASLCYSSEEGQEMLRQAVKMNAEVFDEPIEAKGKLSLWEYDI